MVESIFVENHKATPLEQPIGVLASLVAGFDRIASRPALLLPPILLDLFLWLGPSLRIRGLIEGAILTLGEFARAEPAAAEQVTAYQAQLGELAGRFNLAAALSSLPVGVPSWMAGLLPPASPLGMRPGIELGSLGTAFVAWAALQVVGLGLGSLYHRSIAGLLAPDLDRGGMWGLWGRMLVVGAMIYAGVFLGSLGLVMLVSLAAMVLPLLGIGLFFVATGMATWFVMYLIFTPHGMVRYRLSIPKAMAESIFLVRWNFSGVVRFLALALLIIWLTNLLWDIPSPDSWLELLSVLGHAIVRTTLLAGSYAFYQGRMNWLAALREAAQARPAV
jgi:hypothetical protein